MKQFSKNKIQRMRNLATGNYGDKTKASSGYRKYNDRREEGDIWEENGKTWTIKNGIKQNKTKLSKARKEMKIPLQCPKCNISMKNSAHKKMYRLYEHCLLCQNKFEHNLIVKGKYKKWLEKEITANFESWTISRHKRFNTWFESLDSKHYIAESGEIEDWTGLTKETKKDIKKHFQDWMDSEKEKTNKLLKGEKL
tara:strand:- start:42 stop:629 length:588 start_codon:yes stop_codon:yes gene_type:complete